jgi:acetate kinase
VTSILVVNAGSTSLKLSLVDEDEKTIPVAALEDVDPRAVAGVAHRVVHGGSRFRDAAVIDEEVRDQISELRSLAPLHNAPALAGIARAEQALPNAVHIAVFDTAFHATMPDEATLYAVPSRWRDEWGVRRYGFHGLSIAWSAERAPELLDRPPDGLRLVVCHLGGGSSITALRDGRSVDTTMGFSPLEGVPMATRSGSVDPAVLVYLERTHGMGADAIDHALTAESGLLALGGSAGMRELETAARGGSDEARFAIELFCHRVAGAVGSMAVAAGRLDAVVFTGGIGERSPGVRMEISRRLGVLGVEIDPALNDSADGDADVATPESHARVLVITSREELIAAGAARDVIGG